MLVYPGVGDQGGMYQDCFQVNGKWLTVSRLVKRVLIIRILLPKQAHYNDPKRCLTMARYELVAHLFGGKHRTESNNNKDWKNDGDTLL